MPLPTHQSWRVLVLFGASGTGKSTAGRDIARLAGYTWLQVDDLRLTLQYSRATLPARTDALYFFETTTDFWTFPVESLVQAFIDVATIMTPAVRAVIDSHLVTGAPMVIEGDGVLPALVDDPVLRPWIETGALRFCCLAAGSRAELAESMVSRGRGDHLADHVRVERQAAANHAFGAWLEEGSRLHGIPVVAARPFATSTDRILASISPQDPQAG